MKKKCQSLFIINILFYLFIFIHKSYIDDDVPQIFFYMALCFSSTLLNDGIRSKENKLVIYSFLDFSVRIVTLIVHFIGIIINGNRFYISFITIVFFISNIILEIIIYSNVKNKKIAEDKKIYQDEINKFIEDYKENKIDKSLLSIEIRDKTKKIMNDLVSFGKIDILLILLFIMLFISRFIYKNYIYTLFLSIGIIIFFINSICNLVYKLEYLENRKTKNIALIMFIFGYIILFIEQVIFSGKIGILGISVRIIGILFFIPLFNTKYLIRKELEKIYRLYKGENENVIFET